MRSTIFGSALLFLWIATGSVSPAEDHTPALAPSLEEVQDDGSIATGLGRRGGMVRIPTMTENPSCAAGWSEAELTTAVQRVLREHPTLILNALEKEPLALADLLERAARLREARSEQERRLAELRNPKSPALDDERPVRGNPRAPVTIVEYSDFECPFCGSASSTVKAVLRQYEGAVRFVYKHNPLSFHPMAEPAARYFEAIAMQGREQAWHFHDQVFAQQKELSRGEKTLEGIAASMEIDRQRLERDLHSETVNRRLAADSEEAARFGFDGTPAFLINGVSLIGSRPKKDFDEIIRQFVAGSIGASGRDDEAKH